MNKIFKTLLIVIVICSMAFTMIACEKPDNQEQNPGNNPGGTTPGVDDSTTIGKGTLLFNAMQLLYRQSDVTMDMQYTFVDANSYMGIVSTGSVLMKAKLPENFVENLNFKDVKAYTKAIEASAHKYGTTSYINEYINETWVIGEYSNSTNISNEYGITANGTRGELTNSYNYSSVEYNDFSEMNRGYVSVLFSNSLVNFEELYFDVLGEITDEFMGSVDKSTTGYEITETIDLKELLEDASTWYKENKSKTIGDLLCEYAEKDQATLCTDIDTIFVDNQSVASFLDKIVAYINTYLGEDEKINVEDLVDYVQEKLGMTTKEVVTMVRDMFDLQLADPEDGVSLYDYFHNLLTSVTFDSLIESIGNPNIKKASDFANIIKDSLFGQNAITVGSILEQVTFSDRTSIGKFLDTLDVDALKIDLSFKIDATGRLLDLSADIDVDLSYTGMTEEYDSEQETWVDVPEFINVDTQITFDSTLNYDEIPASTFDAPNPRPTLKASNLYFSQEEYENALNNGYTVDAIIGSSNYKYALGTIYLCDYEENENYEYQYIDAINNKITYKGKTLAEYNSSTGKLILKPALFEYGISHLEMYTYYDSDRDGDIDTNDDYYTSDYSIGTMFMYE